MPKSCNLNTEAAPKSDSCSTTYELFTANYLARRGHLYSPFDHKICIIAATPKEA